MGAATVHDRVSATGATCEATLSAEDGIFGRALALQRFAFYLKHSITQSIEAAVTQQLRSAECVIKVKRKPL